MLKVHETLRSVIDGTFKASQECVYYGPLKVKLLRNLNETFRDS